jgi:hypothetical protein
MTADEQVGDIAGYPVEGTMTHGAAYHIARRSAFSITLIAVRQNTTIEWDH